MRYIYMTVMSLFDMTPSQNQAPPIRELSMNSISKRKKSLKFGLSAILKLAIDLSFHQFHLGLTIEHGVWLILSWSAEICIISAIPTTLRQQLVTCYRNSQV